MQWNRLFAVGYNSRGKYLFHTRGVFSFTMGRSASLKKNMGSSLASSKKKREWRMDGAQPNGFTAGQHVMRQRDPPPPPADRHGARAADLGLISIYLEFVPFMWRILKQIFLDWKGNEYFTGDDWRIMLRMQNIYRYKMKNIYKIIPAPGQEGEMLMHQICAWAVRNS